MQHNFSDFEKGDLNKEHELLSDEQKSAVTSEIASVSGIKTSLLILSDSDLSAAAKIYGERYLNTKKVILVKNWNELFEIISGYERIKHLVLIFHGACDELQVGAEVYGLNHSAKIFQAFLDEQKSKPPIVNTIQFSSCNIGRCPDAMLDFVNHFKVETVIAWNHYLVSHNMSFKISTGMDFKIVKDFQDKYRDYFFPKTSLLNKPLGGATKNYSFWLEWAQSDNIERKPPYPPPRPSDDDMINWIQEVGDWKRFCKPIKNCNVNSTLISGKNIEELRKNASEVRQRYEIQGEEMLACEQIRIDFTNIEKT